jgi:hypothetical protein
MRPYNIIPSPRKRAEVDNERLIMAFNAEEMLYELDE